MIQSKFKWESAKLFSQDSKMQNHPPLQKQRRVILWKEFDWKHGWSIKECEENNKLITLDKNNVKTNRNHRIKLAK